MASGAELAMILRAKDEASPTFDKVKSSAGGLSSGMSSMMGGLALAGGAVTGVMAIGQAITSVASSMVSGNVEMETYQTQLGTLLGGADAAKTRIQELAKIGAETPFDLPQLVAAEKIMAGFGLTTEKTQQLTGRSLDQYRMAIGDMAAATGAPLDEVTLLWSKFGSGATGEAISRLQELGIVTREQMAAMGVEFSKSGELVTPVPQAMKIAMDLANEKMGGGMKALSSTFAGQMSTLSDNFGQAKVLLMAPIFDVLKDGLTGLNEMLSSETFTESIKSMAEAGAAGISTLIEVFGTLGGLFGGMETEGRVDLLDRWFPPGVSDGIIDTIYELGGAYRAFIDTMSGDPPEMWSGIGQAAVVAGTLMREWFTIIADNWRTVIEVFTSGWSPDESINPITNAVGMLALVLRDQVIPAVLTVAGFIVEQLGTVVAWVVQNWPLILETITTALGAISAFWDAHGAAIITIVQSAWTVISTVIAGALDIVLSAIRTVMQVINGDWPGAWETISGVTARTMERIGTILSAAFDAWYALMDSATGGMLTSIGTWMAETANAINNGMIETGRFFTEGWEAVKATASSILPAIRDAIISVWHLVPEDIRVDCEKILTTLIDRGAAWVTGVGTAAGNMLTAITTKLGEIVTAATVWAETTFLAPITGLITTAGAEAEKVGASMLSPITTKLGEVITWIGTWVGDFLSPITNLIGAAGAEAGKIGQSIVDGIVSALGRGIQAIKDAAYAAARAAIDTALAVIQPGSPSRVFTELGLTIPAGLAKGITDGIDDVTVAMNLVAPRPTLQPSFAGAGFGGGFGGGGGPGVTVNVYAGNLVHERDVPSFVAQGLDQALRQGAGFGRGR